jgi:hypothetical protein
MEQMPAIPKAFHVRMNILSLLLFAIDVFMVSHAVRSIMTKGPSMMIMFGFEVGQVVHSLLHEGFDLLLST